MNCGCKIVIQHSQVEGVRPVQAQTIEFCPLHAAAEELLQACRQVVRANSKKHPVYHPVYVEICREAIARAKGGKSET